MHCLDVENKSNTKNISIKLGVHQSSISHAIKDLISEGLAAKTDHAYELTNFGKLQISLLNDMNNTLESLMQNKDFFLTHDMDDIPINYQVGIGMICSQQERLNDDSSTPYYKQEYLVEHLSSCKEIRCIPSVITSDYAKSIANAIKTGADIEIILSDRVLQTLRRDYTRFLKDVLGCNNLKIYRIKEAKFSLWVTESNLFLGLHRSDGCYDLENIIICKSESAMEWGNMLFNHFKKKAKSVGNSVI